MSARRNSTAWWFDDLRAEGLALLGVARAASNAARAMPTAWAAMPMRPTDRLASATRIALALSAQQRIGADDAILEGDLAGVGRFLAELLLDRCDAIAGRAWSAR